MLTGAAIWLWMDALRAREIAIRIGRELCEGNGVQLLDQSVALDRLRLRRSAGRLQWCRRYRFDVSLDGSDRHRGHLDLDGDRLATWSLPWNGDASAGAGPT
ncbi:MAG TPA: DUF3301 domain-containing protein [Rhodanobacteraceae bacterium]|nr:DUF3301 domain-containing protein [Rhodanobacteraceae bacterium]